jgi:hypothetical protein
VKNYFELLDKWNTPDDVIKFLKGFVFSYTGIKSIKKSHRPLFLDLEEMVENKTGVCGNIAYFFVKTLNFMNPEYASLAITYTWGVRTSPDKIYKVANQIGTYRIPIWHENDRLYFLYFDDLDYTTLRRIGPFYSLNDLHNKILIYAKASLVFVEQKVEIQTGVHILDVRVANDQRVRKALDFFGVDNLESWYGKHKIKNINTLEGK